MDSTNLLNKSPYSERDTKKKLRELLGLPPLIQKANIKKEPKIKANTLSAFDLKTKNANIKLEKNATNSKKSEKDHNQRSINRNKNNSNKIIKTEVNAGQKKVVNKSAGVNVAKVKPKEDHSTKKKLTESVKAKSKVATTKPVNKVNSKDQTKSSQSNVKVKNEKNISKEKNKLKPPVKQTAEKLKKEKVKSVKVIKSESQAKPQSKTTKNKPTKINQKSEVLKVNKENKRTDGSSKLGKKAVETKKSSTSKPSKPKMQISSKKTTIGDKKSKCESSKLKNNKMDDSIDDLLVKYSKLIKMSKNHKVILPNDVRKRAAKLNSCPVPKKTAKTADLTVKKQTKKNVNGNCSKNKCKLEQKCKSEISGDRKKKQRKNLKIESKKSTSTSESSEDSNSLESSYEESSEDSEQHSKINLAKTNLNSSWTSYYSESGQCDSYSETCSDSECSECSCCEEESEEEEENSEAEEEGSEEEGEEEEEEEEEDGEENSDFSSDDEYSDWSTDASDYCPLSEKEAVYIPKGSAIKHDAPMDARFDSDAEEAQIFEMSSENLTISNSNKTKAIEYQMTPTNATQKCQVTQENIVTPVEIGTINVSTEANSKTLHINDIDDNDSCPELIPIDFENSLFGPYQNAYSESDSSYTYFSDQDASFSETSDSNLHFSESGDANIYSSESDDANMYSSESDDANMYSSESDDANMYSAESNHVKMDSSESDDIKLDSNESNGVKMDSSESNDVKLDSNESNGVKMDSNESNDVKLDSNESNGVKMDSYQTNLKNVEINTKVNIPSVNEPLKTKSTTIPTKNKFYNSINSNYVLVLVKEPIYVYGTLNLKTVAGIVEIFGYTPKINETVKLFSPKGNSSLKIQPKPNKNQINLRQLKFGFLQQYENDFLRTDLQEVFKNYNSQTDVILHLECNDYDKKIVMIKKYMKENVFPNMNSLSATNRATYASEIILRCVLNKNSHNCIKIDSQWKMVTLNSSSKTMIIGGKGVGKSTLLRYLVNKTLSERNFRKILIIDLDIGQPELFIPQTISATVVDKPLLGPGFFYGYAPNKSFVFGNINVVFSPSTYLENVKQLIKYCSENEEFKSIPWVVNTMGYNKGFGSELIAAISKLLRPTDIIQLQSQQEINNFDYIMNRDAIENIPNLIFGNVEEHNNDVTLEHRTLVFNTYFDVKSRKSFEWNMSPIDIRHTNLLARFGKILDEGSEWLTDVKPVCASLADLEIITFGEDELEKNDIINAVNGNFVYLCSKLKNKQVYECYGIGIVRAIDLNQQKIYLLPSCATDKLTNVDCLAVCNIPLPTSILLNQGPKIKANVPYVCNSIEFDASRCTKQIYFRPETYFQGNSKPILD